MSRKVWLIGLIFLANLAFVSAFTEVNIYVDHIGDALFFGETDENITLPEGVTLQNGLIRGVTSNTTRKIGEEWFFQYYLPNAEMNIILPLGATIKEVTQGEVYLENDRMAVYTKGGGTISYTIENAPNSNMNMIFFLISMVLVMSLLLVFYHDKILPKKVKETGDISNLLNDRENLILDKLKETGKIKSSQLRKSLGLPKASFSRHLAELEKKQLITRTGEGKNKIIELIG